MNLLSQLQKKFTKLKLTCIQMVTHFFLNIKGMNGVRLLDQILLHKITLLLIVMCNWIGFKDLLNVSGNDFLKAFNDRRCFSLFVYIFPYRRGDISIRFTVNAVGRFQHNRGAVVGRGSDIFV